MQKQLLLITPYQLGFHSDYNYWCKYLSKKYSIKYYSFKNSEKEVYIDNVNVEYFKMYNNPILRIVSYYWSTVMAIKSNESSIIILGQYKLDFIIRLFLPFTKIIYDIRTGGVSQKAFNRNLSNLNIIISSLLFNNITIINEGLRKKLMISRKKATIIPLGSEEISKNNKNFDNLELLYIGTFTNRNINLTIEGFARFVKKYPNTRYHIVGYGHKNEENEFHRQIQKYELKENVFLYGRKSHEEVASLFQKCNVGISFVPIASYYQNQPPTKTFEYLLSGMVCIATKTVANQDIINHDNGILIMDTVEDFYNGLLKLSKNSSIYNSKTIRESVRNNKWEEIINTKLEPYLSQY